MQATGKDSHYQQQQQLVQQRQLHVPKVPVHAKRGMLHQCLQIKLCMQGVLAHICSLVG
jgi:hypothetical protein